jgi:hypothetical protein
MISEGGAPLCAEPEGATWAPLPVMDFDSASRMWRANKEQDACSRQWTYPLVVGDDCYFRVSKLGRWRPGRVAKIVEGRVSIVASTVDSDIVEVAPAEDFVRRWSTTSLRQCTDEEGGFTERDEGRGPRRKRRRIVTSFSGKVRPPCLAPLSHPFEERTPGPVRSSPGIPP